MYDSRLNLSNQVVTEVKQYVLDSIQYAFALHLQRFRNAYALGKKFAACSCNFTNGTKISPDLILSE